MLDTRTPALTAASGSQDADAALLRPWEPEWVAALRATRHDVYHLPGYVDVDARRVGGQAVAYRYREGSRVLLQPLILRQVPGTDPDDHDAGPLPGPVLDAISPYGYSGPVSDAPLADDGFWRRACEALPGCLAGAGVVSCFVRLHPLLPPRLDALARVGRLVQHGHTVTIDLRAEEQGQWAQVRPNHRRQINRARRSGITVSLDDWSRMGEFVDAYHETMTRVGASPEYFFDREYFGGLHAALGEGAHLAIAEREGEMLAGGLFLSHAGILQYHLGATRTEHLPEQPIKLIFDDVRRWAGELGWTDFHLGGGVGGSEDSLFHFKAGFSRDRPAFFTWRLVCDPDAYHRLVERAGVPPDAGGHFPAYRAAAAASATHDRIGPADPGDPLGRQ